MEQRTVRKQIVYLEAKESRDCPRTAGVITQIGLGHSAEV